MRPSPRTKDRFSWQEHLRQALLMLPFGHMYFEQVYRIDEGGNRARLRKLAPRMPKTIEKIDVARDGGLVSITQYAVTSNERQQPIPVDRLVAYVHDREAGNWLGSSLLRPAYKHWLIKDRLLRVQAQTIERNGMGIPLYKAQEGATPDDIAAGAAMAQAWRAGEAAGSAVPAGADLILRGVEGDLPDADPAVRYHDEQIARAVLAHFLNLGTQTGSWALGTTFADFFTLSLQTLAQQIADTATCHIVEDLVDINFGENEPAPRIVFDEIGSRQAATATALKALFDAGAIFPDENLEEALRQQYGLPPRSSDTPAVETPAASAPADPSTDPSMQPDMSPSE
jgi:phage gp29-like protein